MKYIVQHCTEYNYSSAVNQCHNEMRMIPRNTASQRVENCKIFITPEPDAYFERDDYYGNRVGSFNIHREHSQLIVYVTSEVDVSFKPFEVSEPCNIEWQNLKSRLVGSQLEEDIIAKEYILPSDLVPLGNDDIEQMAKRFFPPGKHIHQALTELTHAIFTEFTYTPGATKVSTPLSSVASHKKGVCQDFAHIAIAVIRSVGLPARYVSGYLETRPPEGKPKLIGADASHAWFSAYIPGRGWVDFDPTNNQQANTTYITVAWGRDYSDVTPLKGVVYGGGNHSLNVRVDVRPCDAPRVHLFQSIEAVDSQRNMAS